MSRRTSRQQNKHDSEVKRLANYYEKQGYSVKADIEKFKQPQNIKNKRPDIIAVKQKEKVIVEVETKDSADKDKNQQEVFKNYADKHENTRFWIKVI